MAKKEKQIERGGLIGELDYKTAKYKTMYWIIFAILIIVSAVCLLPPIWVLVSSLKDIEEYYRVPPTIIPRSINFGKLIDLWKSHNFTRYYLNTIYVCAGTILFTIVCNGFMGYCVSKMRVKGSKVVFALILATYLLPNTVSMVSVYMNIIDFPILHTNMLNTYWPLFFMAGANAFMVIVYKSFFDGIPDALLEAGGIDGCSDFGLFWRIVLPLSKPVIFTSVILTLNAAWGDFFWPYLILKDRSKFTIMVDIFIMNRTSEIQIDTILMSIAISILPPAVMFVFFQKYIMQGFTMSGIKG